MRVTEAEMVDGVEVIGAFWKLLLSSVWRIVLCSVANWPACRSAGGAFGGRSGERLTWRDAKVDRRQEVKVEEQ